ncbi:MAG TPA: HEAT repeat domain-containing protein [Pirellulales bacterium]|nr:HEAT repeat domain-containing protein [Pirellulales bacterium]
MNKKRTEADWLSDFLNKEGQFIEAVECHLADSLRTNTTDLGVVHALLRHPDARVRGCVAWSLNELAERVGDFLPAVLQGLDDPSDDVRYWCTLALKQVPAEHKLGAVVSALALLEDDTSSVRRAAADVIHALGRRHFELALDTDPMKFELSAAKATLIGKVQDKLRPGYYEQTAIDDDPHSRVSSRRLHELGRAVRLGYSCADIAQSISFRLHTIPSDALSDANHYLTLRAKELAVRLIHDLRSLATGPDITIRRDSWLALNSLMLEVSKWQRLIKEAAKDHDNNVRKLCFFSLAHGPTPDVIHTVIESSVDLSDDTVRDAALDALKQLVWAAVHIATLKTDRLQVFLKGIDDSSVSVETRRNLLDVLQGFAEIFLRSETGIDWATILARNIEDEL